MKAKLFFVFLTVLLALASVVTPSYAAGDTTELAYVPDESYVYHSYVYDLTATSAQSLTIDLDMDQMFSGANTIIDALGSPYLYIAGLSLGVAILAAVLAAVKGLRIG